MALAREEYVEAAWFFGMVEALREQIGYLLEPLPCAEYEEAVDRVRAHLEPKAFEAAWTEGHAMSEAEAVISALNYVQGQIGL